MEFSFIEGSSAPNQEIAKNLLKMAMNGKWVDVVEELRENPFFLVTGVTKTNDTLLHLAVSEGKEKTVQKMINIISDPLVPLPNFESLQLRNNQGNTALHLAAMAGNVAMCKSIARVDSSLINERNNNGESPLFTAVLFGKKQAFQCLYDLCRNNDERHGCSRNRLTGDTILHSAISEDHFDLALGIIQLYGKVLANAVNVEGITPLHLLAEKPWAFQSGSDLLHHGFCTTIIYHCIFIDEHEVDQNVLHHPNALDQYYPENCKTCTDFFLIFGGFVRSFVLAPVLAIFRGKVREQIRDEERPGTQPEDPELSARNGAWKHRFSLSMYGLFYKIFKLANRTIMIVLLTLEIPMIRKIYEEKKKHMLCIVIMKKLLTSSEDEILNSYFCNGKKPNALSTADEIDDPDEPISSTFEDDDMRKDQTPILIAARNGISEIVEKLLEQFPIAIHDLNEDNMNAMLLAVQSRQPQVIQILLQKNILVRDIVLRVVDKSGNNAAHLAAKLGKYRPWLKLGEALHMQYEIKWFEFVIESIPSKFLTRPNADEKTPVEVFIEDHRDLAMKGGERLVKTSESYSVVAALIATVAFATSNAVPGGIKEDNGIPTLENRTAFHLFAISSLIALCFSVTALVTFLSIITSSSYYARDFGKDLPTKLLMGLTSLFFSIAAMLINFGSGPFFVINGEVKYVAYTVYAVACLPITLFAAMQFELYFELIDSTFIRKVPRRSYNMASMPPFTK